jgi:hypothetical protein
MWMTSKCLSDSFAAVCQTVSAGAKLPTTAELEFSPAHSDHILSAPPTCPEGGRAAGGSVSRWVRCHTAPLSYSQMNSLSSLLLWTALVVVNIVVIPWRYSEGSTPRRGARSSGARQRASSTLQGCCWPVAHTSSSG